MLNQSKLEDYLRTEIGLSDEALNTIRKPSPDKVGHPHMVLYQYGLLTLEELDKVATWIVNESCISEEA